MNELVTTDLTTTSLAIAKLFGREHRSILRTIRSVIKDMSKEDLTLRKIVQCFKINELANNKREPYFELGEEMTLVITGRLTGSNALNAQMKLADAFIAMRDHIKNSQAILSAQDAEMLRITRINPNTLKAITGERSNNAVRKNYQALVDAELLEETIKVVYKRVYLPTQKALDYVSTSHHDIVRFKPEYHELIVDAVNAYKQQLSSENMDLFLSEANEPNE